MPGPYRGGCLCGAIRYEAKAFGARMGYCHCSMCRKFHGAACVAFGEAKKDDFAWLSGEADLQAFVAPNGTTRRFCKHCGSSMTFAAKNGPDVVEVALGTLDDHPDQKPDAHIFVGSKATWSDITDALPQHHGAREE